MEAPQLDADGKMYLMNRVLLIFCCFTFVNSLQNDTKNKIVKLTMKQGLLMNQVLATYSLDNVENPICKNHTNRFKNGLRFFEPWALNMFDASSKIQAGVLLGNLVEFGSFKQCVNINYEGIVGKHCLIKITPTLDLIKKIISFRNVTEKRFPKIRLIIEKSALMWSVCVPSSCPVGDVVQHFERVVMEITNGLNLTVSLDEEHCLTREDEFKFGVEAYISLTVLLFIVFLCITSTILDVFLTSKNRLILSFSISSNFKKIVSKRKKTELECLHGCRFLSTCYVVVGHRYLMAMFTPVINGLEILNWILNYSSTIIIGGTICVDTFFMISGLLVSVNFFEYVSKNGSFNLFTFYLYRYFRITPTLGIVVLIYATLIQFLGSGPLWYDTCMAHLQPCRYYWWSTLLHIQSYVNPGSLCILQTWYLTCDMVFFFFSPIILYPLWKNKPLGLLNLFIIYIFSLAISFYLAWINKYEGGMPITNQLFGTKYFQEHYITPHTRASPYIIGLGFGYCIFKMKGKELKMNLFINLIGWFISVTIMVASVVGCHIFQLEDHDYNRLEASLFLSCSRSAWTTGLVWMIWSCVNGYGGIINSFLSSYVFRVLGRVSYGMFLLHLILQLFKNGANKMPIYFSNFTAIYDSFADLLLITIISSIFTLFYELPIINLQDLFLKRKKVQPDNNN